MKLEIGDNISWTKKVFVPKGMESYYIDTDGKGKIVYIYKDQIVLLHNHNLKIIDTSYTITNNGK